MQMSTAQLNMWNGYWAPYVMPCLSQSQSKESCEEAEERLW